MFNLLTRPRRCARLATLAAITLVLSSCSGSSDDAAGTGDGNLKIRIPVQTDLSSLVVMAGEEKGFFATNGLEVTSSKATDTTQLPTLAGKTFDVVCVTPTQFISAASRGIDLTVISGKETDTAADEGGGLLVPADSPIKDFGDLAGKRIGTPSVTGTMILGVHKLMQQQGADPKSIQPVQGAAAQLGDLLAAGRFDAITALEPILTSLTKKGFRNIGDPFRAVGDEAILGMCVAPTAYVKSHPELPEKFRASIQAAGEWIAKDPAAASDLFVRKAGVPKAVMEGVQLPHFDSKILTDNLVAWQDLMLEMGMLRKPIDIKAHVS